jgi:hypothetical protein
MYISGNMLDAAWPLPVGCRVFGPGQASGHIPKREQRRFQMLDDFLLQHIGRRQIVQISQTQVFVFMGGFSSQPEKKGQARQTDAACKPLSAVICIEIGRISLPRISIGRKSLPQTFFLDQGR